MSFRESTSGKLVEATDVYTNLSDSKRKFLITDGRRKTTARTPRAQKSKPKGSKVNSVKPIVVDKENDDVEDIEERRTRRLTF